MTSPSPPSSNHVSLTELGTDSQEIKELQKALGTAATGVAHLAIVATMTAAASLIELRNDGYLQGVSGVLGDTSNLVQHAREVISTDACDGEATSL